MAVCTNELAINSESAKFGLAALIVAEVPWNGEDGSASGLMRNEGFETNDTVNEQCISPFFAEKEHCSLMALSAPKRVVSLSRKEDKSPLYPPNSITSNEQV